MEIKKVFDSSYYFVRNGLFFFDCPYCKIGMYYKKQDGKAYMCKKCNKTFMPAFIEVEMDKPDN